MNTHSKEDSNKDTDIFILAKKFKESADYTGYLLYLFYHFVVRNIYLLAALFIIGVIGGYFIDKYKSNSYRHEIIVVANFGSVNYLYEKIKGINLENTSIQEVEIKPITDIYAFIKERYQNLEMAKYMSDNSIKFENYQSNQYTENFHRYHVITLHSNELDDEGSIINKFMNMLNQGAYFEERQKMEKLGLSNQIIEFKKSIEDINNVLDRLGGEGVDGSNVSVTTYPDLFQLLNVKKSMMEDLRKFEIEQIEQSKTIYDTTRITNILNKKLRYIIVMPILLLSIFFFIVLLKVSYIRYKLMHNDHKVKTN